LNSYIYRFYRPAKILHTPPSISPGQVWWFLFRLYVSPVAWALSDPQAATEAGAAQAEAGLQV